jgi:hypothetical protein
MFCLFSPPLAIMNLIMALLPSFSNYRNTINTKTTTGCCSSGRHGRRGRHTNRHHTWWNGSSHQNNNNKNKDVSSRKSHRKEQSKKEQDILQKIDLLQYFDPLIIPSNMFVIDDDVFYDTSNDKINESHEQRWMPDDPLPSLAITTTTINSFQAIRVFVGIFISKKMRDKKKRKMKIFSIPKKDEGRF